MMLITERPIWYWATMDGQPTLKNFDDIRAADAERTYLEGRDLRRSMVGLEPKLASRSMSFGAEAAELHLRTRGDQARMLRIAWDYTMHGGNKAKFRMPGDHSCKLCGREDSAEHWMSQCPASWPSNNRKRVRDKVAAVIATIPMEQRIEREFALALQWLVEEGPGSGMHRMGLYLREVVDALFQHLQITELDGRMIRTLRQTALRMTKVWIEGVVADHCYKKDGNEKKAHNAHFEDMKKRKMKKHQLAVEQHKLRKDKERALATETRGGRITEYYAMATRDL